MDQNRDTRSGSKTSFFNKFLFSVAFSGDWKKISTTGAEEFFAAHEVKPENVEKLKKSALAEMVTHMKDNGSSLTFSRTLTLDG